MEKILKAFGLKNESYILDNYGNGHINTTLRLKSINGHPDYILQQVNSKVFTNPHVISQTINLAAEYLDQHHPDYLFLNYIKTKENQDYFEEDGKWWRLLNFIPNSKSIDTANDTKLAYAAAKSFGLLTRNLNGLKLENLNPSIENFHNLKFRFSQFEEALQHGNDSRKYESAEIIEFYLSQSSLVDYYSEIINDKNYPDRLVHHDTKINNVLFSTETNESLCVCDLDTLMPGKIISDVGDMVRTYTCIYDENSTDFSKIMVRPDYFKALYNGYLSEMRDILTSSEKNSLFYAGPFMIYMQGLRFLTDFLFDDKYYPIEYPTQNLNRAINQKCLLKNLLNNQEKLRKLIQA